MGYCADQISGSEITVANPEAVLQAIAVWEKEQAPINYLNMKQLSWCDPVGDYLTKYRYQLDGKSEALAELLRDYGFGAETNEHGQTVVTHWGGDKLGSCYDVIWSCLAKGVTGEHVWIMRGEDNTMWADVIIDGKYVTGDVKTTYEVAQ